MPTMPQYDVFISYAREDIDSAWRLYDELRAADLQVWFDQEKLLPGQLWEPAIRTAIEDSRYFVALLSSNAVNRRGFVHKEMVAALDMLDAIPETEIFLIPVRLDECSPAHSKLKKLHYVDMFPEWTAGISKILASIRLEDNDIQRSLQSSRHRVTLEASLQNYHIIHGTHESPTILAPVEGSLTESQTLCDRLWAHILEHAQPSEHFELQLTINGNLMSVSHGVELSAPGGGVQGYGAFRKIAEAEENAPIDLDRLFAGGYGGNYFVSDTITLAIERPGSNFQSEQIVVHSSPNGFSFDSASAPTKATLKLAPRSPSILIDDVAFAGEPETKAKALALELRNFLRSHVNASPMLSLSPFSTNELQDIRKELIGNLPIDRPSKGFQVAQFTVDYILRTTVLLK